MEDDELARLVETLALVREIERLLAAHLAAQEGHICFIPETDDAGQ